LTFNRLYWYILIEEFIFFSIILAKDSIIMLDGNDKETFHSINLLYHTISSFKKFPIFWLGAGTSSWCGYPRWDNLSDQFNSYFLRNEKKYVKEKGRELLDLKKYPDFFSYCKIINKCIYFNLMNEIFSPQKSTSVFERFCRELSDINPCFIITTNIDQSLEGNLPQHAVIHRDDIESCKNYIQMKKSFICKIHGSLSPIQSIVFTKEDYEELILNEKYITLLKYIFSMGIVIFLGYSLSDQYVIGDVPKIVETGEAAESCG
jgi:hypothetical protein